MYAELTTLIDNWCAIFEPKSEKLSQFYLKR